MKAVRIFNKAESEKRRGVSGEHLRRAVCRLLFTSFCLLTSCAVTYAQGALSPDPLPKFNKEPKVVQPSDAPKDGLPAPLRKVAIEQKLNQQVPLDLIFRDEEGRERKLAEFFGQKPVVLSLVYYDCPMLCTQVLNGLVASMKVLKFDAGKEYEVVTVSFDPREGPALAREKKDGYLRRYNREGASAGWHFLTGDEASIAALTDAVGFRYAWDEETKQFAHASAIMILTPEGKISRYFYGIDYPAKDMRLGLVEASNNRIGSPVDQILLYCFHYDPRTGKYGFVIMNGLRAAGVATFLGLGLLIFVLKRREGLKNSF